MSKKVFGKKKKKIAIIILSVGGGIFATSLLFAAFICNGGSGVSTNIQDKTGDVQAINDPSHVATYDTTFGQEHHVTSHYVEKYDDALEATHKKYVSYRASNNIDEYILSSSGDSYAVAYAEDFLSDLADEIDNYYAQIQIDRADVNASHFIRLDTLKETFHNDSESIKDFIIECEKQIADLDSSDPTYFEQKDNLEEKIEIEHARLETLEDEYEANVYYENVEYNADIDALDAAEKEVLLFKEEILIESTKVNNAASQIEEPVEDKKQIVKPTPIFNDFECEEVVEELESNFIEISSSGIPDNINEQIERFDTSDSDISYILFDDPIIMVDRPKLEEYK